MYRDSGYCVLRCTPVVTAGSATATVLHTVLHTVLYCSTEQRCTVVGHYRELAVYLLLARGELWWYAAEYHYRPSLLCKLVGSSMNSSMLSNGPCTSC